MMDESKGYIMTIVGIVATSILLYRIDYQINNEMVQCAISIVLAILFCLLYVIEVIGNIAKFVTGFIVSYVMGMPLYWRVVKLIIPEDMQLLVVMLCFVLVGIVIGFLLRNYTENTFLEAQVGINTGRFLYAFFKPISSMNKNIQCRIEAKKSKEDKKDSSIKRKMLEFDELKAENEKLRILFSSFESENTSLKLENGRLKLENTSLKAENIGLKEENITMKSRMELFENNNKKSSFHNNGLESLFSEADSDIRKKRYRKLSQIFHPDSEVGNAEIFRKIKEAYEGVENY